jgi:hypothetical protein
MANKTMELLPTGDLPAPFEIRLKTMELVLPLAAALSKA